MSEIKYQRINILSQGSQLIPLL